MEWKLWAEQQVREQTVKGKFPSCHSIRARARNVSFSVVSTTNSQDKIRAEPLQLFLRNNKLWDFSFATIPPIKEIPACLPFLMTQQECELTPDCVYSSFVSIRRSLHAQRWNARDALAFPLKDIHQDGNTNTCNYLFTSGLFFRACFKRGENIKYLEFHADKVNENIWDTLTAATEGFIHIWNTTGGQDTLNVTS